VRCFARRLRAECRRDDSRGALLIEILIALAILGIISTVFIGAMYTALHSARIADERSIALTLAKNEIEFVKQHPCSTEVPWSYTVTYTDGTPSFSGAPTPSWWPADPESLSWPSSPDFDGYLVKISGTEEEAGLQKVTASVEHGSETVLTLENYKTDR